LIVSVASTAVYQCGERDGRHCGSGENDQEAGKDCNPNEDGREDPWFQPAVHRSHRDYRHHRFQQNPDCLPWLVAHFSPF